MARRASAAGRPATLAHLWLLPLEPTDGASVGQAARLLDGEERARARRFARAEDRRRYVLAHAHLRCALAHHLGTAPGELGLRRGPGGKPYLPGAAIHVSLAHTRGMAAVAIAGRPCGVDVEHEGRPLDDGEGMAARVLSPPERRRLGAVPRAERGRALLRAWCVKEALLKGTGRGLADDPAALELPPWSGDGPLPAIPGRGSWRAWGLRVGTGHIVGLAVEDRSDPAEVRVRVGSPAPGGPA